jgi:hypothetical protein
LERVNKQSTTSLSICWSFYKRYHKDARFNHQDNYKSAAIVLGILRLSIPENSVFLMELTREEFVLTYIFLPLRFKSGEYYNYSFMDTMLRSLGDT